MSKKRKRKISKTEKSLKNKIYKTNSKNKQIASEINELEKLDGRSFYVYETETEKKYRLKKQKQTKTRIKPKRRKLKTILDLKRNEMTKNNTKVQKATETLVNRFKYKPKDYGETEFQSKKDSFISPEFLAWEQKDAVNWITSKVKDREPRMLAEFIIKIESVHSKMGSKHIATGVYTVGQGLKYRYKLIKDDENFNS